MHTYFWQLSLSLSLSLAVSLARKSNHKSSTNTTQKAIRLFQRHCVLSRFVEGDTNFTVENNSGCSADNASGTRRRMRRCLLPLWQLQSIRISMTMQRDRERESENKALQAQRANLGGKSWPAPYARIVLGTAEAALVAGSCLDVVQFA